MNDGPACPADCRVLVVDGFQDTASSLSRAGYSDVVEVPGAKLASALTEGPPPHVLLAGLKTSGDSGELLLPPGVDEVLIADQPMPAVVALLPPAVSEVDSDSDDEMAARGRERALAKLRQQGVVDVLSAPCYPRALAVLWKAAARRSMSSELRRVCSDYAADCPPTLYSAVAPSLEASTSTTPWRRASMLDAMGVSEPCHAQTFSSERPLLAWLAEREQDADGNNGGPGRSAFVFYNILAHLSEHHANYGTPWGISMLHNFAVAPDGSVNCVFSSSVHSDIEELYAAPEGALAGTPSDVYTAGCVLFRMLHRMDPGADPAKAMVELRHRILPMGFLQSKPVEAAFVLSMLQPNPAARPTVPQLMTSELLAPAAAEHNRRKLASRGSRDRLMAEADVEQAAVDSAAMTQRGDSALDLERAAVVTDIMAAFLAQMYTRLHQQHAELRAQANHVDADLSEVRSSLGELQLNREVSPQDCAGNKRRRSTCPGGDWLRLTPEEESAAGRERGTQSARCFLRDDMDIFSCIEPREGEVEASAPSTTAAPGAPTVAADAEDRISRRWARLERQLPIMESMYLQHCAACRKQGAEDGKGADGSPLASHLAAFAKDLNKFSKFGRLRRHAALVQSSLHVSQGSHMICSMAFGCEDHMFATAGTATHKIKLYQVAPLLRHQGPDGESDRASGGAAAHYPLMEFETDDKLSSISWNRYLRNYLVSSDYGGAVTLWDTGKGERVRSFTEHGKRVWSADFSVLDPKLILSGGDDSTVRLWSVSEPCSAMSLRLCAPAYSVKFSPTNANLLAVGCANYRAYLYDIRNTGTPLLSIAGHQKAVSYVRFMGGGQLVTGSTDSTVKHWDVPDGLEASNGPRLRACYRDHVNEKCFVGLDVREDGYILAGSETNEVACYYSGLPAPVLRHKFTNQHQIAGRRPAASSVAWSTASNLFLAANSVGSVELLEMTSC
eukprot:jgi/Tetstr1/430237/TSEL_020065.t1